MCQVSDRGKVVTCDLGGLHVIPAHEMDDDIHVLRITAPAEQPNELTIEGMFTRFTALEEVLDLSHNNISALQDSDFLDLSELRLLNVSHNQIAQVSSSESPFRFLANLTTLDLSENRLEALTPGFFDGLQRLQRLDLGGNPLMSLDPDSLKDLRPLRELGLARCQLSRLPPIVYQHLPNLESLDLQCYRRARFYDQISRKLAGQPIEQLAPEEFRHLPGLRILRLDGNRLKRIPEYVLAGNALSRLGLARNQLSVLSPCAFCNSSIEDLDMSHNALLSGDGDPLMPLAASLDRLDLSWNPLFGDSAAALVRSLGRLRVLRLDGLGLRHLPLETFAGVPALRELGLRHNRFRSLPPGLLAPLRSLQSLDVAFNRLRGLSPETVSELDSLPELSRLAAHDNPWQCDECNVGELSRWLAHRGLNCCGPCPTCAGPPNLADQPLASLPKEGLQPCTESVELQRLSRARSQVRQAFLYSRENRLRVYAARGSQQNKRRILAIPLCGTLHANTRA
ncbi:hypothetical protein HPB48_020455 [Haemaphysalis longicornis]|uniref:Uncharacterized protein n=1 Tax=Haemaphysalis longicornis TaxID=44386 RepID=A0A9J6FN77_HAELO|nr:hypothetical protein HPB48_020455 [Haemaphysalis longicornis]